MIARRAAQFSRQFGELGEPSSFQLHSWLHRLFVLFPSIQQRMEELKTIEVKGSGESTNAANQGYEWENDFDDGSGSDDENDHLLSAAADALGANGLRTSPDHLNTSPTTGLSETEVKARLRVYGYNELQEAKPNYFKIIFKYFSGPLEIMLLLAAALAGGLQEWVDFGVIFAVQSGQFCAPFAYSHCISCCSLMPLLGSSKSTKQAASFPT